MHKAKILREESLLEPKPTDWQSYQRGTDWVREETEFDPRTHYHKFDRDSDCARNATPFKHNPKKRSIGGGYNKEGVRFTVNANGEVLPEGCGFKTDVHGPEISIQKVFTIE